MCFQTVDNQVLSTKCFLSAQGQPDVFNLHRLYTQAEEREVGAAADVEQRQGDGDVDRRVRVRGVADDEGEEGEVVGADEGHPDDRADATLRPPLIGRQIGRRMSTTTIWCTGTDQGCGVPAHYTHSVIQC